MFTPRSNRAVLSTCAARIWRSCIAPWKRRHRPQTVFLPSFRASGIGPHGATKWVRTQIPVWESNAMPRTRASVTLRARNSPGSATPCGSPRRTGLNGRLTRQNQKELRPRSGNRARTWTHFAVAAIRRYRRALASAKSFTPDGITWTSNQGFCSCQTARPEGSLFYLCGDTFDPFALPRIEGNSYIIAGAKDGEPRADLKKPWAALTKATGLEGVRLHDLRHSFASIGAGASMGLPVIGKLLGHSQPSTTARYAHLDADLMRRAVDAIGATISAAMDKSGGSNVVPLKMPA